MSRDGVVSKKIGYGFFVLVGVLFVFFFKTGSDLAKWGNIRWTGEYTAGLLLLSLCVGCLLGGSVCFVLYRKAQGKLFGGKGIHCFASKNSTPRLAARFMKLSSPRVFALCFCLIMLGFLPVYLAFYPGICAYDITIQMEQLEQNFLNDHHPLAHTLLIKGMLVVGTRILGSVNAGIALYVAVQLLLLAGAFAYGVMLLHRRQVKWYWQLAGLLYCLLFPFHHYMAVSTTKDTIFSAFFLVFVLTLTELLQKRENSFKLRGAEAVLLVSGVGVILFRNNGKYAVLILLVGLLFALWRGKRSRRMYGRVLGVVAVALAIGQLVLSGMFAVTGAGQGDKREMLSMPIQQLARCMIYHGGVGVLSEDDNTMSDEAKALINDFLLNESYKNYQASLSDPVKTHTNTYVVRFRTVEFLKTYLQLLAEYPGDFINAALAVNAGYLYPGDVSHAYVYERAGAVGEGYVHFIWAEERLNGWGVYKDSKWEGLHDVMERWADENAYLKLPALRYVFVPGSYLWLYLVVAGYLLITRRFSMLLPMSPVLGYYITLLLGPTVQLRYLYPLMITFLFLFLMNIGQTNAEAEGRACDEEICG